MKMLIALILLLAFTNGCSVVASELIKTHQESRRPVIKAKYEKEKQKRINRNIEFCKNLCYSSYEIMPDIDCLDACVDKVSDLEHVSALYEQCWDDLDKSGTGSRIDSNGKSDRQYSNNTRRVAACVTAEIKSKCPQPNNPYYNDCEYVLAMIATGRGLINGTKYEMFPWVKV